MKRFIIMLMLLFPLTGIAQEGVETTTPLLLEGANFFVCIVAGVLLAVGFQLLLTVLSVAAGITAIPNLDESHHKHHDSHKKAHHDDDDEGMNMGQKISTGLGAWTMITTSIALFFASMLAVKLGLVGANFIGATLGLVIWAAFFMAMTYLEMSAVSSLIGGLVSTVKNGLSSAFSTFSSSDASIAKDVAKTNAKAQAKEMRKQFEKLFQTHDVDKKVNDYVKQLKPQHIDIHQIKKEIKDLLTHIQVTEKADFDYPNSVKKLILEEADKSTLSKEHKQAIKDHVNSLKDIAKGDAPNEEKIKQGIEDLTHADREKIDMYQEKVVAALRNTNKDELQPETLEQDLIQILNEPGQASNLIKAKASAIDRETLIKIMASQNMDEAEADNYIRKVENVLQKVSSFFGSTGSSASAKNHEVQSKVRSLFSGGGSTNNLNRIYSDFTHIFQSSADGSDLKYKLKHYNREQLTDHIMMETSLSRTEAEPIADKIVSARDSVLNKANEVEAMVNEKMATAKRKSMEAAEETRKTAVTAAWWLVATAILSAAASAVGGMLALEGWFM